jgi:hypothetical protein
VNLQIRVSEQHGAASRVIDITLPGSSTLSPAVDLPVDLIAGESELVAGDGADALEALGEISRSLDCPNTLDDMLCAIDQLKLSRPGAKGPRFVKLDDAGQSLPADATAWAAVHDTTTGLIWSAETIGGKRLKHAKAKAACEKLVLAGATDWQLPTRTQLLTLVDDTRHEPAIDTAFFPKTESAWYWTSTPCAWRPGSAAWCVFFSSGHVNFNFRDDECFVRAVRVASPAAGQ